MVHVQIQAEQAQLNYHFFYHELKFNLFLLYIYFTICLLRSV